jgi:hypothetical protein
MFGTNKLCMKGIYLPTFQRSIILRANECTQLFTQLDNLWREKLVSLLVSLYMINANAIISWTFLFNSIPIFIHMFSLSNLLFKVKLRRLSLEVSSLKHSILTFYLAK